MGSERCFRPILPIWKLWERDTMKWESYEVNRSRILFEMRFLLKVGVATTIVHFFNRPTWEPTVSVVKFEVILQIRCTFSSIERVRCKQGGRGYHPIFLIFSLHHKISKWNVPHVLLAFFKTLETTHGPIYRELLAAFGVLCG